MFVRNFAALTAAATLLGLTAAPAFAQMRMSSPSSAASDETESRPGDIWTGGGLIFAPRYLDNPGDLELGLGPTYLVNSAPGKAAIPFAGVLGFSWKMTDSLELAAIAGPLTLAGLRGPISESEYGSVGWALVYRSDMYPVGTLTGTTFTEPTALPQGLNKAPLLGGLAMSQGGELRIEGMQKLGPINLFALPNLGVMSDGTRVGLGLGLDLDFDRVVLGGNWVSRLNITPTQAIQNAKTTFENQYSAGGRLVMTDSLYLVTNFVYIPADAYGNNVSNFLAGIGYRFSSGHSSGGEQMRRSK
jgi:hypothetical protein